MPLKELEKYFMHSLIEKSRRRDSNQPRRFTKQLLYQLSYAGKKIAKVGTLKAQALFVKSTKILVKTFSLIA